MYDSIAVLVPRGDRRRARWSVRGGRLMPAHQLNARRFFPPPSSLFPPRSFFLAPRSSLSPLSRPSVFRLSRRLNIPDAASCAASAPPRLFPRLCSRPLAPRVPPLSRSCAGISRSCAALSRSVPPSHARVPPFAFRAPALLSLPRQPTRALVRARILIRALVQYAVLLLCGLSIPVGINGYF
ncbi:hypothetical protein EVG20_g11604 [Dentipellis fragilis]|uniref:Uncharacterized protein n=1 Tax=Dentipellis fragilis TaxID=205917 RepID=A0A4Y9XK04_9AGAM|nr:hypothetical protein EVG20_g11604 [Dentipellis fragilis]